MVEPPNAMVNNRKLGCYAPKKKWNQRKKEILNIFENAAGLPLLRWLTGSPLSSIGYPGATGAASSRNLFPARLGTRTELRAPFVRLARDIGTAGFALSPGSLWAAWGAAKSRSSSVAMAGARRFEKLLPILF